jgi:hypothetical protein
MKQTTLFRIRAAVALALLSASVQAQTTRPATTFEVEGQAVWTSRIDVQSPNTAAGSRFALDGLTGSGASTEGRLELSHEFRPRHEVRAVYAPLSVSGTGVLPSAVAFQGQNFAAGPATQGRFQFDSYRLGYRYLWLDRPDLTVKVGATLKVRDAAISLRQGALYAERTDTGVVPLLHVRAEQRLGPRWRLIGDVDGLVGPNGRAFDIAAKVSYDITRDFSIAAGYRMLDGGADNSTVYTMSRFHYGVVSLTARF